MSIDLVLQSVCSGCGSTTDLYGSNCKHMTLCLSCGKTMAESSGSCLHCGVKITRLIREYNVRANSSNDKNYFIGRFMSGLPHFSKMKSDANRWTIQKDGLRGRQVNGFLRGKFKNKPWLLEDERSQSQYHGVLEGSQSATYYLLMMQGKEFVAIPAGSWFNFNKVAQYKQLTLEEAEEKMKNRRKTADGYERWMMKAANTGPSIFGEKEENLDTKERGGGRGRKTTLDEDEGNVSDKGEEDEEEEAARKNRHGLNKKDGGGDDEEEGLRGGDFELDDDDIEKGDDWEHEETFTDDDEAIGDHDETEEVDHDAPAPPEIKEDEEDEDERDEEGGGLSKSGKELRKLLGRTTGQNESNSDDSNDDDNEDDIDLPPFVTAKLKGAPKEEATPKPVASFPPRGTLATPNSANEKRKSNADETKASTGAALKKLKTENEPKSNIKTESATHAGPVTENEIRAVLLQNARVSTQDLVAKFKGRLKGPEDRNTFADNLKRIGKMQKINGANVVVLRDN